MIIWLGASVGVRIIDFGVDMPSEVCINVVLVVPVSHAIDVRASVMIDVALGSVVHALIVVGA